jgi:hypothetical protein
MSKVILVLLSLLLIGMTAEAAFARTIRPIGYASASAVRAACVKAGGTFNQEGSSYNCTKTNCDGNGGGCTVSCNNGSCTGSTPARGAGQDSIIGTLFGVKKEPSRQSQPSGSISGTSSGDALPDMPAPSQPVPDIGQPAPTPPPIL